MPSYHDWEQLLERYVSGACSPSEEQAGRRGLAERGESVVAVEALRAARLAEAQVAPGPERLDSVKGRDTSAFHRLNTTLSARGALPVTRSPVVSAFRSYRVGPSVWAGVMAMSVVLIGAGLSVRHVLGGRSTQQPFREFASAPGSRTMVTLRDGTQLILGPASHIRIPTDFGVDTRAVALDGEALFTVVHDPKHPFMVRTAHTVIHDVGTVFIVHAYATDLQEQVAVREGAIRIGAQSLKPQDVALIDTLGRLTLRSGVNIEPYMQWVQGGLVFDHTPLRDALREIGRAFDLDITVDDSTLLAHHLTSSFDRESADEILAAVSLAVGADVTKSGRHVVFHRRKNAADPWSSTSRPSVILTDRLTPTAH